MSPEETATVHRAVVAVGRGRWRAQVRPRSLVVAVILGLVALAISVFAVFSGRYGIAVRDVAGALVGERSGRTRLVVVEWRLPRAVAALVFGAALAISGGIFQSVSRNPLGSPDIIGFNTGAATGALLAIQGTDGSYRNLALGALAGGTVTAVVVYLLAHRRGVQGFRLILTGISVAALLGAVNHWLFLRADEFERVRGEVWQTGSLNAITWAQVTPALVLLAVLVPVALALGRPMRWLELGDETARGLGLRVERVRLGLLLVGVALTATVTAATGPISFVALAAPQLAHRLVRSAGHSLVPAAAMGAVLLALSDVVAQRAFTRPLPVGLVTVSIGGLYFVWLLAREGRR